MATIVLGLVGSAAFGPVGGLIGSGIGAVVDNVIIGAIQRANAPTPQPPDILRHPGADEGIGAPWVQGPETRVQGQVIWMSSIRQIETPGEDKDKSDQIVIWEFFVDIAIAWCRTETDPTTPIKFIWASGERIFIGGGTTITISADLFTVQPITDEAVFDFAGADATTVLVPSKCSQAQINTGKRRRREKFNLFFSVPVGSQSEEDMIFLVAGKQITIFGLNVANNGTHFIEAIADLGDDTVDHSFVIRILICTYIYDDSVGGNSCVPTNDGTCNPAFAENGPLAFTFQQLIDENDSPYFDDIECFNGSSTQLPDSKIEEDKGIGNVPAFRGTTYCRITNFNITKWAGTIPQFEAHVNEAETRLLADAIENIGARAESLDPGVIDTQPVRDAGTELRGIFSVGPIAPSDLLSQLVELFSLEVQETFRFLGADQTPTSVLRFFPQADAEVISLVEVDTTARNFGEDGHKSMVITRTSRDDLPQELILDYINKGNELQPGTSSYYVTTAAIRNQLKLTVSVTFSADEADEISRVTLWKAIYQHDSMVLGLLPSRMAILPGDRVTISVFLGAVDIRGRVIKVDRGLNGLVEVECRIDSDLIYDQDPGGDTPPDRVSILDHPPAVSAEALDMAPLRSTPDAGTFGIYFGIRTGSNPNGIGSTKIFTTQDLLVFTERATFTQGVIAGSADTVLGDTDPHFFDIVNEVEIIMDDPAAVLSNLTQEQVYEGQNAAYLGGEIIGFTTAELLSTGFYKLSGLVRGRNDTFPQTSTHVRGETFVLLPPTGPGLGFVQLEPNIFKLNLTARAVPSTLSLDDPDVQEADTQIRPNAETLRPYRVHGIWATRRADTEDICVFCTGRTRIPFRLFSALPAPFIEQGDAEDYVADVFWLNTPTSYEFLRRLIGCRTLCKQISFHYKRACQIADLHDTGRITDGSFPFRFRFVIFRLSDSIGDGRTREFCADGYGLIITSDCSFT